MRAVVVYESMFGNTHRVAEAVGRGLESAFEVVVVRVGDAAAALAAESDVLVVGGPTHVHGMSGRRTRAMAVAATRKPGSNLVLEPHADSDGLREWLASMPCGTGVAAAFDTRMSRAALFTGRASKRIGRQLRHRGYSMLARPESFLVDDDNHLQSGEEHRAFAWGQQLAAAATARVRSVS